jgi:4-hydroxythreonine-4-phosphate dehydrogenase
MKRPLIAITMGDAAGIGPEIIAKALSDKETYSACRPIVIGDADALQMGVMLSDPSVKIHSVKVVEDAKFESGLIDVLDLDNIDVNLLEMGKPQAMTGRASVDYIKKGAELAITRKIDAIVTAPVSKEAINMAGYSFTGHTELLAELSNTSNFAMLLIAGKLRVIHVTTHVALKEVSDFITKERVLTTINLAVLASNKLGIHRPRIGVSGLNPHCGDGGLFGDEEINEISPAIQEAKKLGINVDGPVPPDTIFSKAAGGAYDVVVAMYHDQGHIPVKLIGFKWNDELKEWENVEGVNATIGLPFIRTSVDHGTAFGKAGRMEGNADPTSLREAVKVALEMSKHGF